MGKRKNRPFPLTGRLKKEERNNISITLREVPAIEKLHHEVTV